MRSQCWTLWLTLPTGMKPGQRRAHVMNPCLTSAISQAWRTTAGASEASLRQVDHNSHRCLHVVESLCPKPRVAMVNKIRFHMELSKPSILHAMQAASTTMSYEQFSWHEVVVVTSPGRNGFDNDCLSHNGRTHTHTSHSVWFKFCHTHTASNIGFGAYVCIYSAGNAV